MAPTFTDRSGRKWAVAFTAETVAVARDELGLNLPRLLDTERPFRWLLDPKSGRLVQLAYLGCHRQAEERGVSPEAFGRLLFHPPTWGAAGFAVVRALAAHFPDTTAGRVVPGQWRKWVAQSN